MLLHKQYSRLRKGDDVLEAENKDIKANIEQQNALIRERQKKILTAIAFIVLITVIIILLIRSFGSNEPSDNPSPDQTQGEWVIGGKRPEGTQNTSIVPENITFSGNDKYTVSSKNKEIELTNPENNQANFVFTVKDARTGEVIAKTGKVAPGQYVYVNIYDHFKKAGGYDITVDISAYSFAGTQLNGASAKAVVTVTAN